jgi:type IV pilus assembly protein PilC
MGQTRRMLWEIAAYPLSVLLMALSIASFFFGLVVPQFRGIFEDFGTHLPTITLLVLNMGTWFTEGRPPGWMIVWGVPVVVAVLWIMLRFSPGGRRVRERIMLVIPVVGQVYRASLVARFLRSVATAVASGLPLPQAMRLSGDATGSRLLSRDAEHLALEVERGNSIFKASKATKIIPSMFGFCAQVATSRDILPMAVGQLALAYENRAVHAQSMLRIYLLPLLLLVVGAIIGLIIVSMFLPLVSLVNSVSGGGS